MLQMLYINLVKIKAHKPIIIHNGEHSFNILKVLFLQNILC